MTAVAHPAQLQRDQRPLMRRLAVASEPWLYSSPALILIIAVMLVPLALGISYAFRDVRLLNPFSGGFVGLQHFEALAGDKNFARALKNTLLWAGASVFFQFTFGLILALLLDRPFRGRAIAQALVFLPWAVPSFLSGLNWAWLFNPVVGPLPHWFFALGLFDAPNNILSDPQHAMWGPIIANVWWGIPFFAITLLAALQAIPRDLYEAASIDGANAWDRFWHVTIPLLLPVLTIVMLFSIIQTFSDFQIVQVLTRGGPTDTTHLFGTLAFQTGMQGGRLGQGAAVALFMLPFLGLLTIAQLWYTRRNASL